MKYKKLVYSQKNGLKICEAELRAARADESLVEVYFSGVNYKDALGVTGKAPIFKVDPIVPGIDFSGVVLEGPLKGKKVLGQGCGIGESFDGGYTQILKIDSKYLIELPDGLSLKEAMALGTAGFTAALAVHRMVVNGQSPDKGPILVSGANGGVGGFAIQILSQLNYEVHAVTTRLEFKKEIEALGAVKVLDYQDFTKSTVRPLEKAQWGGVIDNLGGDFLEQVLPQVNLWGSVASIGLARGAKFNASVMPQILRGVSLLGVSSTNCEMALRKKLWSKLAGPWRPAQITERLETSLFLKDVLSYSNDLLNRKCKGRAVVDIKSS